MSMHVWIVSTAKEERMHTPRMLKEEGIPFTLVVDTDEQRATCKKLGYKSVILEHAAIADKRNDITAAAGGWYIGMDDNIKGFTMVTKSLRNEDFIDTSDSQARPWRRLFNKPCSATDYVDALHDLASKAHDCGAKYAGVATMDNPFFRMRRYGHRRFVKSKVFVMSPKGGVQFKHSMCHDSYASAHAVALHGTVLTDSRMFYDANWYEKGGLGDRAAREAKGLLVQLQECVDEFPGLVGIAKGKNSALRFLKTSDKSVQTWRAEHGWLSPRKKS